MRHWSKPGAVGSFADSRKPFTWTKPNLGTKVGGSKPPKPLPPTSKIGV